MKSLRLGCWRGRRRASDGGESGPEEIAERLSQAHNGNGSQMRCRSAVTSASAGGRRAGVKGRRRPTKRALVRSEEHTSELQSQSNLVCRLLLEKKKNNL